MLKFQIEQIALFPGLGTNKAFLLLKDLGLDDWVYDTVTAAGQVFGSDGKNEADLAFNYQSGSDKPLELEVLHYSKGHNWMDESIAKGTVSGVGAVSHLGMHVTREQLDEFAAVMQKHGIRIAQEVFTNGHTNPAIKDSRRYNYVIYDTRKILGVDLKFIVRLPYPA
jgi:hypothetical protein